MTWSGGAGACGAAASWGAPGRTCGAAACGGAGASVRPCGVPLAGPGGGRVINPAPRPPGGNAPVPAPFRLTVSPTLTAGKPAGISAPLVPAGTRPAPPAVGNNAPPAPGVKLTASVLATEEPKINTHQN